MKKSMRVLIFSSLTVMSVAMTACSNSGNSSPAAPPTTDPYGTSGVGYDPNQVYGYWQLDRIQQHAADASGLIRIRSHVVMGELMNIQPNTLEIYGFPMDAVSRYNGSGVVQNQTLTYQMPGTMAWVQLPITVANGPELLVAERHFHRITADQYVQMRLTYGAWVARDGNESGYYPGGGVRPRHDNDRNHDHGRDTDRGHRNDHDGDRNDRDHHDDDRGPKPGPGQHRRASVSGNADVGIAQDIPAPADWNGELAELPASGFEMHLVPNVHDHEVYQEANVACWQDAKRGLIAQIATSDGDSLIQAKFFVPKDLWRASEHRKGDVRHLFTQVSAFNQPMQIERRVRASDRTPFEVWAYASTQNGRIILEPSGVGRAGCRMDFTVKKGMLQAQVRCEELPGEFRIPNSGVQTDHGFVTAQFACPILANPPAAQPIPPQHIPEPKFPESPAPARVTAQQALDAASVPGR